MNFKFFVVLVLLISSCASNPKKQTDIELFDFDDFKKFTSENIVLNTYLGGYYPVQTEVSDRTLNAEFDRSLVYPYFQLNSESFGSILNVPSLGEAFDYSDNDFLYGDSFVLILEYENIAFVFIGGLKCCSVLIGISENFVSGGHYELFTVKGAPYFFHSFESMGMHNKAMDLYSQNIGDIPKRHISILDIYDRVNDLESSP